MDAAFGRRLIKWRSQCLSVALSLCCITLAGVSPAGTAFISAFDEIPATLIAVSLVDDLAIDAVSLLKTRAPSEFP